jgi:ABC-type transport system involved in cytochrome c biogenesis permease subunit
VPAQLAGEFAKVRPTWLPVRLAYGVLTALGVLLAAFLVAALARGRYGPLLAAHVLAVTVGYAAALAVGGVAVCAVLERAALGRDAGRDGAVRQATRRLAPLSLALTAVGVALGAVWAREHLGRYWGWDLKEVGGFSVLCWAVLLALCVYAQRRWWLPVLLLAVAGTVVVSLSWFGPPLLAERQMLGTTPWAWALVLGAFLVAQLVVGVLALLPPGRLKTLPGGFEVKA